MFPNLSKNLILVAALAVPAAVAVTAAPFPMASVPSPDLVAGADTSLTETYCDQREVVGETLRHDFAEEPRIAALTEAGMTMELWASDVLGTWTVVHHGTDGISCIVTSGQDWSDETDAVTLIDGVLAETLHQS